MVVYVTNTPVRAALACPWTGGDDPTER